MDDDRSEDETETFVEGLMADPQAWAGLARGPRPPAEGVRIIGAEEAAAAVESGSVAPRMADDGPRFGDVPPAPSGPRSSIRFPGVDPSSVPKPPVVQSVAADPPMEPRSSGRSRFAPPDPPWTTAADASATAEDPGSQSPGRFSSDRAGPSEAPPVDEAVKRHFWDEPPPSWAPSLGDPDDDAGMAHSGRIEPSGPVSLPHWTEPPTGEVPRILADDSSTETTDSADSSASMAGGLRWRDQANDWDESAFAGGALDDESAKLGALREDAEDEDDDGLFTGPRPGAGPSTAARRSGRQPGSSSKSSAPARPLTGRSGLDGDPLAPEPRRATSRSSRPPTGRSDLKSRVLTGAGAGGVALAAAKIGPLALVLLIGAVLVVASAELFQALRARGYQPATLLGVVATGSLVAATYARGEAAFGLVSTLMVMFCLLWYLLGVVRTRPTMNVAVTLMAFVYVGGLGSFAAAILRFPLGHGVGLLLGAIIVTVAHDVGSYFAGRWKGKTLLAPAISPKKTVEGLIGGTLSALVVSVLVVGSIAPWSQSRGRALWLGVVVAVVAPLGDLCESMIKRDLDVKDMGTTLPGHGGVLDRVDALLFVIPAVYYLVRLLNFG